MYWQFRVVRCFIPPLSLSIRDQVGEDDTDAFMRAIGDGKVSLWKENLKGKFEEVSELTS